MSKKKKNVIWVTVLSVICGLMFWHVVGWHSAEIYLEMLNWTGTGKVYITVAYNLGLMLVFGAVLGFLMERITNLMGYEVS